MSNYGFVPGSFGQSAAGGQPVSGQIPPPVWVPPVPVYPYAPWIRRVGGYLIDFAPNYIAAIPLTMGYVLWIGQLLGSAWDLTAAADSPAFFVLDHAVRWLMVGLVVMLIALGWQWYNRWLTAGRTGQSLGKRVVKLRLVAEVNGQPIGPVNAFLRDLLHVLDGAAYLGFLWPLWDAKRQTFADMIMKTVVTDQRGSASPAPVTLPN